MAVTVWQVSSLWRKWNMWLESVNTKTNVLAGPVLVYLEYTSVCSQQFRHQISSQTSVILKEIKGTWFHFLHCNNLTAISYFVFLKLYFIWKRCHYLCWYHIEYCGDQLQIIQEAVWFANCPTLVLPLLSEWTWDGAIWDTGSGGWDQARYREASRVGSSSASGEEPPHYIGWGLRASRAPWSGPHHWCLELSLGCHPAAAGRSYCCRYHVYPCVFIYQYSFRCRAYSTCATIVGMSKPPFAQILLHWHFAHHHREQGRQISLTEILITKEGLFKVNLLSFSYLYCYSVVYY